MWFHSQKTVVEFASVFVAMIVLPLVTFFFSRKLIVPLLFASEHLQAAMSAILAVVMVWAIIVFYTLRVVRDPSNFKYEQEQMRQKKD